MTALYRCFKYNIHKGGVVFEAPTTSVVHYRIPYLLMLFTANTAAFCFCFVAVTE